MLTILERYKETDKTVSYYARLNYNTFIIYIPKECNILSRGDKINCTCKKMESQFLNNYNEFDYGRYLKSIGIVGRLYISEVEVLEKSNSYSYLEEFKEYVNDSFYSDISGLLISISTGNKELLSDDLKEIFSKAGISHILAISGSAIYILRKILRKIFKKFKYNEYLILIIVLIYTLFCNFSISILRAFLMYFISFIFSKLKKDKNKLYYVLITMIILLIINPYYIFNSAYWYSNVAVISIITIMPIISSKFKIIHLKMYKTKNDFILRKKLKFRIERYLLNSLSLTLSIQIMLFPINIYLGNSINFISLISNLLINFLYIPEYILSFLLILLFKVPFLNTLISYILKILTNIIVYIAKIFSNLSFLSIRINKPWIITVILLYIIIVYIFYGYIIKFKIKYMFKNKKRFNVVFKLFWIILALIIVFNIYFSYFAPFVYYFNIGQGNMSILRCDNRVVMFDIGSSTNDVSSILINFLKAYNINKIDYIFLSHMHSDHINGLYNLEKEIEEGSLGIGAVCANSLNEEMTEFLDKNGIKYINLKKGDEFNFKNINIKVLSPNYPNEINAKDMLNANSMITSFTINGKTLLYMGDGTIETEKVLIENYEKNEYYLLQVGHHGSSTSTSKEFLDKFSFKYAVISSKKSVYGHPSEIVTLNLYEHNIKFTILEERGGIRFWL